MKCTRLPVMNNEIMVISREVPGQHDFDFSLLDLVSTKGGAHVM